MAYMLVTPEDPIEKKIIHIIFGPEDYDRTEK